MEHIHGIDVSWMTHGSLKDKIARVPGRQRSYSEHGRGSPGSSPVPPSSPTPQNHTNSPIASSPPSTTTTSPRPIPSPRPGLGRSMSASEKLGSSPGSSPQRRGSWFSNISSRFSGNGGTGGGGGGGQSPPQTNHTPAKNAEISVPRPNPSKNAVLQHAVMPNGDGPYTPAPPKSNQAGGILHVFRRLSASSSNGNLGSGFKGPHHGLVERRVLNVDPHRPRCPISDLNQAKLRRVAFCVDVEIAPMPKYDRGDGVCAATAGKCDKAQKRKMTEKGEAEALKHPQAVEEQKEHDGVVRATGEALSKEPEKEGAETGKENPSGKTEAATTGATSTTTATSPEGTPAPKQPDTRKKEKKKKSEEERKARKEKKRRLAEANGSIPMEIRIDSDSSGPSTPTANGPKPPQTVPTTNPVRIYRRCCQLRETPILKKITEQLLDTANFSAETGMVEKLDLTGYWMQFADLVTLGDYMAVVPIREIILENCGLGDESLRVVLAGILAAKKTDSLRRRRLSTAGGGGGGGDTATTEQGGVVERLVLKNNKIGPEGWKHICLFIYLCRSLKHLDLSGLAFPKTFKDAGHAGGQPPANGTRNEHHDFCDLFSRSLGERLGGSTLALLNLGETGVGSEQLECVMDGVIGCGIKKLGLAHNNIDGRGVQYVAKYLRSGKCEGLDLGGNDMRDQLEEIADALTESDPLAFLSLAECNLKPNSLCKLFPKLTKLPNFRFIDLSHNHDLFRSSPSALPVLRRYLPKMDSLKRIHLADCSMTSEQAIALAEILPEVPGLAHISFLQNPDIVRLMDAKTEEAKEEACALFASLLAATRLSSSIICVDIEVPSEQSSELVKAMAKQVIACCLRNMERLPMSELAAATVAQTEASAKHDTEYPDVLQHLVGHDPTGPPELDEDIEVAPDDDYVIGGTGVVKALTCCLKNRGDDSESRRQSGEFLREPEAEAPVPEQERHQQQQQPRPNVPSGKAKDMSKHLLSGARKIRYRLQPAIARAKEAAGEDMHAYQRLVFLDNILKGIIKRFEDEFPETRETHDENGRPIPASPDGTSAAPVLGSSPSSSAGGETEVLAQLGGSDAEEEPENAVRPQSLSRSSSMISLTSKALANEEGRILRAGHKFRVGFVKPEQYKLLLSGVEEVGSDPQHARVLHDMLVDLGDEELLAKAREVGVVRVFQEDRERVLRRLREEDPEYWERFAEAQEMARKNVNVDDDAAGLLMKGPPESTVVEEEVVEVA